MFARGPVADLFVPLAAQHRLMLTSSIAMLASYDDFARNCRTSGLPDCSPGDHSSRQTSPNHSDYEISHQKPEAEMKSRDSDVEGPKAAVHTELNMNKRSLDDGEDAILDVETCCNDVAASNDVNIEASVSAKRERENNEKTIKKEVLKFGIDRILIETSSTSSAAPSATTLMRRPSLSDDVSKPDRQSASEDLSASPRSNSWISQLYSTTIPTSSVRCRPGFSDSYSARSSLFLSSSDHVPSLIHDRYGQVLNHQLPSTVGREESAPSRHSAFAFQHGGTPSHRSYDVISSGYQLIPSNGIGYRSNSTQNSCSPGSKKKRSWSRAVFSNLQRKGLEKRFEVQKYVTKPDRRQLAAMLGLTDAQVKVWFQNRRMKWRHQEEAKKTNGEQDPLRQVITTSRSDACVVAGGQNGQTNHCCSDDDDDDSSVEDACDLGIGCGSRGRPVSMTSTVCSVTSYDKSPSSGRQSNSRKLASVMSVADILDLRSPVVSSTCRQTLI